MDGFICDYQSQFFVTAVLGWVDTNNRSVVDSLDILLTDTVYTNPIIIQICLSNNVNYAVLTLIFTLHFYRDTVINASIKQQSPQRILHMHASFRTPPYFICHITQLMNAQ